MGDIYLVRHGEVAWNRENTYAGRTDLPLNDTGRAQGETLAQCLAEIDISAVYSSSLTRARETAEIIAGRLGLGVTPIDALQEVNYGEWEGISEKEIQERDPELYRRWRADPVHVGIPGGETFGGVAERALPAFEEIARRHPEEKIVVVAHKSVNRVLLCCLLGVDVNRYRSIAQENCAVNHIVMRSDGRFVVHSINDRCHMPQGPCVDTGT